MPSRKSIGSKSTERADPIRSPADLDEILAGKLQQISACRVRATLRKEACNQARQGTQSNMSLQTAPVCPEMGIKLGFKPQFCPLLVSCVSLGKSLNLSEPYPHG